MSAITKLGRLNLRYAPTPRKKKNEIPPWIVPYEVKAKKERKTQKQTWLPTYSLGIHTIPIAHVTCSVAVGVKFYRRFCNPPTPPPVLHSLILI